MIRALCNAPSAGSVAASSKVFAVALLLMSTTARAQYGTTFAYTGEDALRDRADVHFTNHGGFANNLAVDGPTVILPYLPSLFYEAGYLVRPANHTANLNVNVTPEVFLNVLFMARVTAMADLVLLNEATNKPAQGIGFRVGAGYGALGSSFDFAEAGPVVRAGFLIGNIRTTYAYSPGNTTVIDHQLAIAIKFDW